MRHMNAIVAAVCIPALVGLFVVLVLEQGFGMAAVSAALIGVAAVIGTRLGRWRVNRRQRWP
jgi:hypothetical protein